MKKFTSIILILLFLIGLVGCGEQSKEEKRTYAAPTTLQKSAVKEISKTSEAESSTESKLSDVVRTEIYQISDPNNLSTCIFEDGVAWVTVATDDRIAGDVALINSLGEILYFKADNNEDESLMTTPFCNGLAAVYYTNERYQSTPEFVIVNTSGKEVYSSSDENTFLSGCDANGNFYITKHDSGFDHDSYFLYVFDSNLDFRELNIEVTNDFSKRFSSTIGISDDLLYFSDYYGYLNLKKKCWFSGGISDMAATASNGKTTVIENRGEYYLVSSDFLGDVTSLEDIGSLLNKGRSINVSTINQRNDIVKTDDSLNIIRWYYSSWREGSFYREYCRKEDQYRVRYREYLDTDGNVIFEFPTFADGVEYTGIDDFSGDYAAIYLKGVDGNQYVSIVDGNGKAQYDPIQIDGDEWFSCGGYIFVYLKSDDSFDIITPEGTHKKLGDDLSGIEKAKVIHTGKYGRFKIAVGAGYVYYCKIADTFSGRRKSTYFSVDGSQQISELTANYNSDDSLVKNDPGYNTVVNS